MWFWMVRFNGGLYIGGGMVEYMVYSVEVGRLEWIYEEIFFDYFCFFRRERNKVISLE